MFNRVSNANTTTVDLALKKNTVDVSVSDEHLFNEAVSNLKQAILSQGKSHRRVATRVRFLIRSIMIGLVSSLFFILYLIYLLNHQVGVLTTSLNSISLKTSQLLTSMSDIEKDVAQFEMTMNVMPSLSDSVRVMNYNVSSLTGHMELVTGNVTTLKNELQQLNGSLSHLSTNAHILEQSVEKINHDMNTITKPAKRFNDFNPFN